jgi:putative membrane protein
MPNLAEKKAAPFDTSTRLAFDRTRVAYDNTLMSWIRTATSLITFGFAIYKFFELELRGGAPDNRIIGTREFALMMVIIGLLSLALGILEHWQNMRTLRAENPEIPRSRASIIAVLVLVLGLMAFVAMIFRQ